MTFKEKPKSPALPHSQKDEFHLLGQRAYFFDEGIHFECQQCGHCCTGAPGVVRISDEEILAVSTFLQTAIGHFKTDCLYPYENGYAIKEHEDGRCLFYEDGCRIYPVRPAQCKAFPFWMKVFRSEDSFERIKKQCPGMGRGRFFSKAEILDLLLIF